MKTIQKGRIGFVLWLLTCTLGSFIGVSIERCQWNKTEGHFMSIPDLILLGGIVTTIALISSTPTILSIYFLSGKSKNLSISVNGIGNDILAQFSIFDSRGKLIRTKAQTNASIDISDLSIGIYYLRIESQNSTKVLKFTKK